MSMELIVNDIQISRGGADLVSKASFKLSEGELVVLLGPNGAGKSSLLRAAMGLDVPTGGGASLGGDDVQTLSPMQRARRAAYLPQIRPLAWPSRVQDVVALGRFAYGGSLSRLNFEDKAAVERALTDCALGALKQRRADTLSGGELARMHCARAFAARAPLLIADEPTAALDPHHSFKIMDMIRNFVGSKGGALVVLHDVNLAAKYADRIIWMKGGRIIADGPPDQTLTPARLADVYGVAATIRDGHVSLSGAL